MPRHSRTTPQPPRSSPSPRPSPPVLPALSWRMGLVASLLVALVVGAAFAPVLDTRALSLDDDDYITHNELVTRPSAAHAAQFFREAARPTTVGGYWMPLSMTSLMLDVAQGGRASNPAPFHRTSLALHVGATVALFWLLALLFGAPLPALLAALVFGLHPLAVEPVAWIGERKTVLAGALTLCAAAMHVAWARYGGPWRRVASWVAFALALLAKPTATLLPLMLLLVDHWPLRRLSKRTIAEKWPFFLLAAASAAITLISHARSATLDLASGSDRMTLPLQASARLVFYAGKLLWPGALSCVYPRLGPYTWTSPEALGALFAVVAMSALAVLWARRRPALLVGWGWFVLALAPVLGWFDYSWVTLSDKYCYLAIAGVTIVLTGALAAAWRQTAAWRMATAGLLGALLFAEAATSRAAIAHWSDSLTLWTHITAVAPNEPGAHSGLGAVLVREQRWPEARIAFERAAALDPRFWVAQVNVSLAALQMGDLPVAEAAATRAVTLMPRGADALVQAAAVAQAANRPADAEQYLRRALEVHPFDAPARVTLAQMLEVQGKLDESMIEVRRALQIHPGLPLAEFGLGHLLIARQGFSAEARAHLEAAVRAQPDWLPPLNELAWWLAASPDSALRDPARALTLATHASQLAGDSSAAVLDTRAVAEAGMGRFDDAMSTTRIAIERAHREGDGALARALIERQASFARRRPWREPPHPATR